MRNPYQTDDVLRRAYIENARPAGDSHIRWCPALLARVRPIHEVVKVDVFIPGCPPSADTIFYALSELVEGRNPDLTDRTRFGV